MIVGFYGFYDMFSVNHRYFSRVYTIWEMFDYNCVTHSTILGKEYDDQFLNPTP